MAPVFAKVGVGVHLEALAAFGVQCYSLRPCGLEVLDQVVYRVPVRCPRNLGEVSALMRRIVDVGTSALVEEVELFHNCSIVEVLIKRIRGSVVMHDLGGQSESLSRRSIIGELDVIYDAVNYLRLC